MIRKLLCWLGFHSYVYDCTLPEMSYNLAKNIRCDWLCWYCKAHKKVCKYCKKLGKRK